ncbi:hypothetical protein [Natronococcus jeotgali]|uniref:Uncharacterized protein n=1 Tax=Natronococcus jeotgali DSM 18795 TaxID=1227498 RepID=L9WVC6_9EURY|nr:hypothetical protein [Natronococcus jeotgali]ELY53377.1 hypothetical protein C492_17650 [Natronococcus jeotgali DSM 18795]
MIGAYTIGKKALLFGYKRYGVPGAILSGGVVLAGYVAVRRLLRGDSNANSLGEALENELEETTTDDDGATDGSSASN